MGGPTRTRTIKIAQAIGAGMSIAATAKIADCSPTTVSKVKKEKKELIEKYQTKYLESLPNAVKIQTQLIDDFETIDSKDDPVRFNASVRASEKLLQVAGIIPSQAPSIFLQNLYQDARSIVLSDQVSDIISRFIPNTIEIATTLSDIDHVIDDEIIDIMQDNQ